MISANPGSEPVPDSDPGSGAGTGIQKKETAAYQVSAYALDEGNSVGGDFMKYKILSVLLLSTVFMICCAGQKMAQASDPAKGLFESKCSRCHSTQKPTSKKRTREGWEETVTRMIKVKGASINDEEAEIIIDYLTNNYGK